MQTIPAQLTTAIRRGDQIPVTTQIIGEWNYNHFTETTVTNSDAPAVKWVENDLYFPLDSLTASMRPKSGIFYAFTNQSYTVGPMDLGISGERFYTVDKDSRYKYWITPTVSSEMDVYLQETNSSSYVILNCAPTVVYDEDIRVNKIRVTFNVGALPTSWKIYARIDGVYEEVANNPSINNGTGVSEIWYDGSAWTTTQNLTEEDFVEIDAIKVVISELDTPRTRLQMLEIAGLRELDISDRVISYDISMSMDEQDFIHPVGSINSNSGTITLSNFDLAVKYNNTGNLSGLLNSWCQFRIYLNYDLTYWGGLETNKIRIATMYTNEWRHQNESEYQIELFDLMKMLQNIKCPPFLVENQKFATIMSRILDMVGCDLYKFQTGDFDNTTIVKYFWTNGEETVYEVLQRLCKSNMSAVFVDEFGVIQLLTRTQIANDEDEAIWDFLAEDSGLDIADTISVKKNSETIANTVTIKYKKREAKVDALDLTGKPLTSKVWGSDDTVVLRASALKRNITASGINQTPTENNSIWVTPKEAEVWPYRSKVNVDGEIFEYYGKGYFVWDFQTQTRTEKLIRSDEDKRKYDLQTWNTYSPGGGMDPTGVTNGHTGRLYVIKRALDNSTESAHYSTIGAGWHMMNMWLANGPTTGPSAGKTFEYGGIHVGAADWKAKVPLYRTQSRWSSADSLLTCNTHDTVNIFHLASVALKKFGGNNNAMREYGTRIRNRTGATSGGIILAVSDKNTYDETDLGPADITNAHTGYIVHVLSTEAADNLGRGWTDEIFVEMKFQGGWIALPSLGNPHVTRGRKWQIDTNKWYDLEVIFKDDVYINGDPNHYIGLEVFIDGQYVDTFVTHHRRHPSPWAGIFVRGPGVVDFDYFYATTTVPPDFSDVDDSLFSSYTLNFPAGTNRTELIEFPRQNRAGGDVAISISSLENATVHSLKVLEEASNDNRWVLLPRTPGSGYVGQPVPNVKLYTKDYGAFTLQAKKRNLYLLKGLGISPHELLINYTSTNPISVCIETSKFAGFEYGGPFYNVDTSQSFWDIYKNGYMSSKLKNLLLNWNPNDSYAYDPLGNTYDRSLFFDEFGSIAHEIREFDVELDIAPVKGLRVFLDNEQCQVSNLSYHPTRGNFTLVNTSRTNEIVNGAEEITDNESINHTLMLYGYVLEEKGDEEKTVKNDLSILRRGEVKLEISADWIFDDSEAESLAQWIVDHWSIPMDTFTIETFSNCFTQIGDKVSLKYTNLGIDDSMLFIVSEIKRNFDNDGFSSSLTLRRVR